jgi:superfamily I DNA/RNA helicase
MKLSPEQKQIINSVGDIKINAVAGSGKTTTIIEYAKSRPEGSKILYLAYNKSVKIEAQNKFAEAGLHHVKIETAHSLAYKNIVFKHNYRVRTQAYRTYDIAELLGLKVGGEKHAEFIAANHINQMISYFCNSDKMKLVELNYQDIVSDKKAYAFVSRYYDYLLQHARILLARMDRGEIEITHDFYLKKFQLAAPQLPYDYILFDEGQDASPAMLDVFIKQKAVKVIVGDTHQQIYSWRFAINSLEQLNFKQYSLNNSFRFPKPIADLSKKILSFKKQMGLKEVPPIEGLGVSKSLKTKAVLARTNLGLLLRAIEFLSEESHIKKIYFEGHISSYTYADDGASIYDVLNLYNGRKSLIKDKLIGLMRNMEDLEEYIENTEDVQLSMMVEIVNKYGNEIPNILKELKEKHLDAADKHKAEIVFSTVHRAKGMEYDEVELVNDFINEKRLDRQLKDEKEAPDLSKLNEEINLLYVAITRTKNKLSIPFVLVPDGISESANIEFVYDDEEEEVETKPVKSSKKLVSYPKAKEKPALVKAFTVDEKRETYKAAYRPWTKELDDELSDLYFSGKKLNVIAEHFGRTKGAILSRLAKLEIENFD